MTDPKTQTPGRMAVGSTFLADWRWELGSIFSTKLQGDGCRGHLTGPERTSKGFVSLGPRREVIGQRLVVDRPGRGFLLLAPCSVPCRQECGHVPCRHRAPGIGHRQPNAVVALREGNDAGYQEYEIQRPRPIDSRVGRVLIIAWRELGRRARSSAQRLAPSLPSAICERPDGKLSRCREEPVMFRRGTR
ncbi:hypothetical protein BT67DRAFT_226404 [Trichocladium antarcticum]|uniref:Uncharacterized protein n=1 Tax=Trichocladium antarcticum TaxID=1450529 RepID=A0AAN6UCP2_9PEZI|nr:hypothetical protein BT67DRAFT_226404 [Trichocladium antarcticum]